jgi:hypothetical protein
MGVALKHPIGGFAYCFRTKQRIAERNGASLSKVA